MRIPRSLYTQLGIYVSRHLKADRDEGVLTTAFGCLTLDYKVKVIRAAHLGMCFGVRDAIALALEHAEAAPLTILGDLVDNPTILNPLASKGIAIASGARD